MSKLRSRSGAEWVRAPIDIRATPDSAADFTEWRCIPPEASVIALPLHSLRACLIIFGLMLSSKIISAPASRHSVTCSRLSTSTST